MNIKDTIKLIIKRFQEASLPTLVARNIQLPLNSKKIVSVIGARRCGKTYMLYETIQKLMEQGVQKEDILFINFEDERLQLKTDELDLIIQAWRELHPNQDLWNHYIFFDEIQNIEGWERFVRRVYDNETKNIFITGSNSVFLATEIATSLRGRTLPYEVFPFSFDEYLRFKKTSNDYFSESARALILNEFRNYLSQGGFPETFGKPIMQQSDILRTYFYVMLYKDLIERYKITSTKAVKYFIDKLADNSTKHFSINKIYNDLRSQGLKLDKNQLYQFMEYVQNIYLAFSIQRFDYSSAARSKSDKKAYFIDNGLLNILNSNFTENYGKLFENAVFLFLKTKFGSIYENNIFYHKTTSECDFLVLDQGKPTYCIQVSYDISDTDTRNREIRGLLKALEFYNLPKGYIITAEQEEQITMSEKTIEVRPAFKVFIDNKID